MGGTKESAKKAKQTIERRYGDDFYAQAGRKGGLAERTSPRGFAANVQLAREAGRKGGVASGASRRRAASERKRPIRETYGETIAGFERVANRFSGW